MGSGSFVKARSIAALLLWALITLAGQAAGVESAGFPKVHAFNSGEPGIFANAYLIETGQSVIAVDATLLESTSKALRRKLVSLGKPLRAILITHGHPDHYNGVTNLRGDSGAEVLATPGVDRVIREYDAAKERQWTPVFGSEWPKRRTFPTRTLASGESFVVDGAAFTVHDLGPGESHSDSYWLMEGGGERAAFIGDEVLNGVHAYVSDGHTTAWLRHLDMLAEELQGVRLYPGHGEAGGMELLDWQRRYLTAYRKAVLDAKPVGGKLSDAQRRQIVVQVLAYLPTKKLEFLIGLGADAVAAELEAGK